MPRPRTPAYPVISDAFGRAFQDIRHGADPAQALTHAARRIDRELRENRHYPSLPAQTTETIKEPTRDPVATRFGHPPHAMQSDPVEASPMPAPPGSLQDEGALRFIAGFSAESAAPIGARNLGHSPSPEPTP